MPRGGYRRGKPGTAYPQRRDLAEQPVRAAPSQAYGERAAAERAQRAIPLPNQNPANAVPQAMGTARPGPTPGSLGGLDRPSDRPGEPITSGLPFGPGPGPDAFAPAFDPVVESLRSAYRIAPNERIAALIEAIEGGR